MRGKKERPSTWPKRITPITFALEGYDQHVANGIVMVECDGHAVSRVKLDGSKYCTLELVFGCVLYPVYVHSSCLHIRPIELDTKPKPEGSYGSVTR